jgi:hypothetical protein
MTDLKELYHAKIGQRFQGLTILGGFPDTAELVITDGIVNGVRRDHKADLMFLGVKVASLDITTTIENEKPRLVGVHVKKAQN